MRHEDDFNGEWRTVRVDNSLPPLRWIANLFGEIGGWAIFRIALFDEQNNFGLRYKFYSLVYDIFMPLYNKYGTYYKIKFEDDDEYM